MHPVPLEAGVLGVVKNKLINNMRCSQLFWNLKSIKRNNYQILVI
jgi:hypothetical protein